MNKYGLALLSAWGQACKTYLNKILIFRKELFVFCTSQTGMTMQFLYFSKLTCFLIMSAYQT